MVLQVRYSTLSVCVSVCVCVCVPACVCVCVPTCVCVCVHMCVCVCVCVIILMRIMRMDICMYVDKRLILLYRLYSSTAFLSRVNLLQPAHLEKAQERGYLEQRGVLRTNCIDCLDRTNVGQFAVGMRFLGASLKVCKSATLLCLHVLLAFALLLCYS